MYTLWEGRCVCNEGEEVVGNTLDFTLSPHTL